MPTVAMSSTTRGRLKSRLTTITSTAAPINAPTALQATVDWYLANGEWCDRVRSGAYRDYYQKQYSQRL